MAKITDFSEDRFAFNFRSKRSKSSFLLIYICYKKPLVFYSICIWRVYCIQYLPIWGKII